MNSGTDFVGTDGLTSMTPGTRIIRGRGDVADQIEIELVIECRVDRTRRAHDEERVSIRGRIHDRLGADIGAAAWPVLDNKWLPKPLRQPLAHQARKDVGR